MNNRPITPERVTVIDDLRRHEGFMSQGLTRMVVSSQSSFEDVEGALAEGWMETAAFQARTMVFDCLAILGMRAGGGLTRSIDDVGVDRVGFAPRAMRERAAELVDQGWSLLTNPDAASKWFADLRAFLEDTEATFELGERLPILRSPEGLFAAIRVLQAEQPVIEELALPSIIPREWVEGLAK